MDELTQEIARNVMMAYMEAIEQEMKNVIEKRGMNWSDCSCVARPGPIISILHNGNTLLEWTPPAIEQTETGSWRFTWEVANKFNNGKLN